MCGFHSEMKLDATSVKVIQLLSPECMQGHRLKSSYAYNHHCVCLNGERDVSVGQTAVRVGKRLQEIFQAALRCHPAVVILDNLHDAMPHFTDVEEQTSGEGLLSLKKVQGMAFNG